MEHPLPKRSSEHSVSPTSHQERIIMPRPRSVPVAAPSTTLKAMDDEKSVGKPFDYKGLLQSIVIKRWKTTVVIKYELEGEVLPRQKFRSQVVLYNKDEEIRRFSLGDPCSLKKDSQQSAAKLAMKELDGIDGIGNARSSSMHELSNDTDSLSPTSPTISRQSMVDAITSSPTGSRNARQYEFSNAFNPRVVGVQVPPGIGGSSTTHISPNSASKSPSNHTETNSGEDEQGNGHSVGLRIISAEYSDRMKQNMDWKGELQMLIVRAYKSDIEIKYGHSIKCNVNSGVEDDGTTGHHSICILRHIDQDHVGTCIVMGKALSMFLLVSLLDLVSPPSSPLIIPQHSSE